MSYSLYANAHTMLSKPSKQEPYFSMHVELSTMVNIHEISIAVDSSKLAIYLGVTWFSLKLL